MKDHGWPIAWIRNSDGSKMTNVPFSAVQTLTENMPKEADVLFLQISCENQGLKDQAIKVSG